MAEIRFSDSDLTVWDAMHVKDVDARFKMYHAFAYGWFLISLFT